MFCSCGEGNCFLVSILLLYSLLWTQFPHVLNLFLLCSTGLGCILGSAIAAWRFPYTDPSDFLKIDRRAIFRQSFQVMARAVCERNTQTTLHTRLMRTSPVFLQI